MNPLIRTHTGILHLSAVIALAIRGEAQEVKEQTGVAFKVVAVTATPNGPEDASLAYLGWTPVQIEPGAEQVAGRQRMEFRQLCGSLTLMFPPVEILTRAAAFFDWYAEGVASGRPVLDARELGDYLAVTEPAVDLTLPGAANLGNNAAAAWTDLRKHLAEIREARQS